MTTPPATTLELQGGRWGGRVGDGEGYIHNSDVGSMQAPSDSTFLPLPLPPFFPPSFPPRIDDEQLEVIGLYSFLHVGKIQVSLAEPLRVGQASEIKVQSFYYACRRGGGNLIGQPHPHHAHKHRTASPTMPTSIGQPHPVLCGGRSSNPKRPFSDLFFPMGRELGPSPPLSKDKIADQFFPYVCGGGVWLNIITLLTP